MRRLSSPAPRCLCGALDCPSCGPAQGSTRCDVCRRLACDEHGTCDECGELAELTVDELCVGCAAAEVAA